MRSPGERWALKTPRAPKDCARCKAPMPLLRHHKTYLCNACKGGLRNSRKSGVEAHLMVSLAVRLGYLRPLFECRCVDCGAPAEHYDHRDYSKPIDVEPVCRKCNYKRGPALGFNPIGINQEQAAA